MYSIQRWKCLSFLVLFCVALTASSQAQTFTNMFSFTGTNGANPWSGPLVQGLDGNYYGTSNTGGAHGYGTVFKITSKGVLTTIYNFCSVTKCTDGQNPEAGLILGTDGNFYGTTFFGGAVQCFTGLGCGTVFKITPAGALTVLHSFTAGTDGFEPRGGLVQATNGNFYGTTANGSNFGFGTVFEITPTGTLTTLHIFQGPDGGAPYAGLIEATNGDLYGTTSLGGAHNTCSLGCGTVFQMTLSGTLTTLHSFDSTDGYSPIAPLFQASNGDLYGTTEYGGSSTYGSIFQITTAGTFTTLHNFVFSDGAYPYGGLTQGTDGKLYGTTEAGGSSANGTVFDITTSGTLATLHQFQGSGTFPNGEFPYAGVFHGTNGTFYGTTNAGGSSNDGIVYSLANGLGAFVQTVPTSGAIGTKVIILGTSLTGSTSVTFNGKAATFTIVSATEITTTVPSGATSGTVKVVTPGGTLSSNITFQIP